MQQLCFDFDLAPPSVAEPSAKQPSPHRQMRGQLAYLAGLAAEDQVVADYLNRGYQLQDARWRGKAGEIDLIFGSAERGYVFVEVKKSSTHDRALASLTHRQSRRIMRSAEDYVGQKHPLRLVDMRFDVALVDQFGAIRVMENLLMATA